MESVNFRVVLPSMESYSGAARNMPAIGDTVHDRQVYCVCSIVNEACVFVK